MADVSPEEEASVVNVESPEMLGDIVAEQRDVTRSSGILQSTGFDPTVGGLLNQEGQDVRKEHTAGEGDVRNQRRKGKWRGAQLTGEAAIVYDFALHTLEYKAEAMQLGADLRLYVIFAIMFIFFFLYGRDINQNYYFARSFKDQFFFTEIARLKNNKQFADISEADDWNRWVYDVVLIQGIDPQYPTGGNYMVGAMRFRTHRVRKDTCSINNDIIPKSMPPQALECYGHWSDNNADVGIESNPYNSVTRWKFKPCADWEGGSRTSGMISSYNCGGYYFIVPWYRNVSDPEAAAAAPFPSDKYERLTRDDTEALYIAPALENDPPYVDNLAMRFVMVELFSYNPTLQTFISVKMFVEQAAGGLWVPNYQVRIFEVWTKTNTPKLVYDVIFLIFVLYYLYRLVKDFVMFYRKEDKILAFFFDTWNLVEIANVVIFLVVFVFRFLWIDRCRSANLQIDTMVYEQKYPAALDDILSYYMMQVYLNSVNTVLTFLKFLKYFRLNDRLNILTQTLKESQDSIIGVLFIFLLVVTAYAMTGHGLFGLGIWQFRSIDASFSTLLQMLIGQFDYEAMKNENRVLAGFFFWSYIILALFCLLNFLIGVLMEAFEEVSATTPILPLESLIAKTWEDWKRLLSCSNIKITVMQHIRGNTRDVLLMQAAASLREFRKEVYPENDENTPEEEKQLLTKPLMIQAFSDDLKSNLGEEYVDYIWDDLVYEWDQSSGAKDAIETQKNLEMTKRGVQEAIGEELTRIEGFSMRLAELDKNLAQLISLLEK